MQPPRATQSFRAFRFAVLVLVSWIVPTSLQAQDLSTGDRVRITTTDRGRLVGVIVEAAGDSLVLDVDPEAHPSGRCVSASGRGCPGRAVTPSPDERRVSVSLPHVLRLERSVGRRPATPEGAAFGAAAGGVVGAILGWALASEECCYDQSRIWGTSLMMLTGAVAGGLSGVIVGRLFSTDEWVDASTDGFAMTVGVGPGGGLAVGMRLR